MIALFREQCKRDYNYDLHARVLRAIVRTAAFGGDPEGSAYSTPRPTADFKDGGGTLYAGDLICAPSPNEGGYDDLVIDLDDGGETPPEGDAPYYPDIGSPGETQSFDLDPENIPSTMRSETLLEFTADPGDRVRFTLAWDGCAAGDSGNAPAGPAVDFDLFLYHEESGTYVWGSQSLDDNNEGFDYTVQSGQAGTYTVRMMWDIEEISCDGTDDEPISYAWMFL